MTIPTKRLLIANIQGVMKTLERTPASDKKQHVSLQLANDFNKTLKTVGEEYPDLVRALPSPLSTHGPVTEIGKAPASFLDLEIVCEQLLNLLGMVED